MTIVKIPNITCNAETITFMVQVTLDHADEKHKIIEHEEGLKEKILEYLESIL